MMEHYKATILIVDDHSNNIFALEHLLSSDDRIFLKATSGSEALRIVLDKPIDLIILDVQMPDMDGFEVMQMLKSNRRTKDIPILFASAEKTEQKSILKGLAEGAVDYLFKPLDPEVTRAKVTVLLKLELQRKELIEKTKALEKSSILINNCTDIICTIDEQLRFEEFNSALCRISGYSMEEIASHSLVLLLTEEDHQQIERLRQSKKDKLSFEVQLCCKDGTSKWLHWNIAVIGGKWFANARDISGQKLANEEIARLNANLHKNIEQLELANKELESFSYSVSHDLRAPLRALNGYAQIVEEEYAETLNADVLSLFGNIKRNSHKMGVLIDDLLGFSRLGKKTLKKNTVNVHELVESVIAETRSIYPHTEIRVETLPDAYADYALIKQVLVNLISNACKYSHKVKEPLVEISAYEDRGNVVYCIKDNGVGFNMDYQNKLFGVFQRLHSEREFEGTGVGLAIVSRIIHKHGGRVWAEAEVNKGAIFYLSLPAEADSEPGENEADTAMHTPDQQML